MSLPTKPKNESARGPADHGDEAGQRFEVVGVRIVDVDVPGYEQQGQQRHGKALHSKAKRHAKGTRMTPWTEAGRASWKKSA